MYWLKIAEIIFGIVVILIGFTQVLVPAIKGRKLFPMFRRQGRLESELAEVQQRSQEASLEDIIKDIRAKKHIMKQEYLHKEGDFWFYDDPNFHTNIKWRGRGITKQAAYRNWCELTSKEFEQ